MLQEAKKNEESHEDKKRKNTKSGMEQTNDQDSKKYIDDDSRDQNNKEGKKESRQANDQENKVIKERFPTPTPLNIIEIIQSDKNIGTMLQESNQDESNPDGLLFSFKAPKDDSKLNDKKTEEEANA